MSSKKVINVVIKPDGKVEVSTSGFKGKACLKAARFLEESLGLDPDKHKPTAEMYQAEETNSQIQRT